MRQTISKEEVLKAYSSANSAVLAGIKSHNNVRLDKGEIEDIVSQAILRALETFNPEKGSAFHVWTGKIAYNILLSYLASARYKNTRSLDRDFGYRDPKPSPAAAGSFTPPDEELEWKERYAEYQQFRKEVTERDRQILDLMDEKVPARLIAAQLGMTPNAVCCKIFRLRAQLKDRLAA